MCHIMIYRQTSKYLQQKTMVRLPQQKEKQWLGWLGLVGQNWHIQLQITFSRKFNQINS